MQRPFSICLPSGLYHLLGKYLSTLQKKALKRLTKRVSPFKEHHPEKLPSAGDSDWNYILRLSVLIEPINLEEFTGSVSEFG